MNLRTLVASFGIAVGLYSSLAIPPQSWGQLIAYDGFEDELYSDGEPEPLDGVPLQLTGPFDDTGNPPVSPGWVGDASEPGAVSRKWVTTDTFGFVYRFGSLHHSSVGYDDASTGSAQFVSYDSSPSNFRSIRRIIDDYEPADTYYMSFLVKTDSLATGELGQRGQALVGFTGVTMSEASYNNQSGQPPIYGLMIGFDGRGTDERISDLVLRANKNVEGTPQFANTVLLAGNVANPGAPANEQVSTLENLTHLILLKLEVNSSEATDLVTYWVNPTDVSSESMATASAQATGTIETLAIDVNDRLTRLQVAVNRYEDRSFSFDEPRFGLDFFSVAGVEPPPEGVIGDYNGDTVVDAADYAVWRDNLGGQALLPNDPTPGINNEADYENWQANFGMMHVVGSGASTTVPEPSSAWMLILGFAVPFGRRIAHERRSFPHR